MNITKEQAIDYWFKFIDSSNVKKQTHYTIGHAEIAALILYKAGDAIISLRLFPLVDNSWTELYFDEQKFEISKEEYDGMFNKWLARDKYIDYSMIDNLL